jgi:alanine dehydrogenase
VYLVDGIVHYCVTNRPGAVSRTSTYALTNVTLPYAVQIADNGIETAAQEDIAIRRGVNVIGGKLVFRAVAEALGLPCDTF